MPATAASTTAGDAAEKNGQPYPGVHMAWQAGIILTVWAGLFHLLNLVEAGRWELGPVLLTPFRAAFILTWLLLLADYGLNKRRPRIDYADVLVAGLVAVFLIRGLFVAETFGIAINWISTGAGVFFLVKHGIGSARDACLVIYAIVAAVLFICLFGVIEYAAKDNPLFDAIQVTAIGSDVRIGASEQFYRIRSLIGHPGYLGALLLISAPLVIMVFRRRRLLLAASLLLMVTVVFLTFSRGTWLLAIVVALPLLLYYGRPWLRHNLKWVAPLMIIIVLVIAFDYWNRDEISISFRDDVAAEGLQLVEGLDGPYESDDGEGIRPLNSYLYFDVSDEFYGDEETPVTVVMRYLDRGLGRIRVEYDSRVTAAESTEAEAALVYRPTASIDKTNTMLWTSAAFYIEDPGFSGRQRGADFRLVDEESLVTVGYVSVQKGKLKLPSVVEQQWVSRWGSFITRLDFFPFTWNILLEHPLGVGLFNTPGTDNHAIDSLPLTWMIEFGWPGLLLLAGMAWLVVAEGLKVYRSPRGPLTALYLSLILVLLHGVHLMILYDKPSLVLTAVIAAVYAAARPWGSSGPAVQLGDGSCAV